jgi:hypothetical protein
MTPLFSKIPRDLGRAGFFVFLLDKERGVPYNNKALIFWAKQNMAV